MYKLESLNPIKMEEITFSELGMKESDIEEIFKKHIDMICYDEKSMLVVGQQVKNAKMAEVIMSYWKHIRVRCQEIKQ